MKSPAMDTSQDLTGDVVAVVPAKDGRNYRLVRADGAFDLLLPAMNADLKAKVGLRWAVRASVVPAFLTAMVVVWAMFLPSRRFIERELLSVFCAFVSFLIFVVGWAVGAAKRHGPLHVRLSEDIVWNGSVLGSRSSAKVVLQNDVVRLVLSEGERSLSCLDHASATVLFEALTCWASVGSS